MRPIAIVSLLLLGASGLGLAQDDDEPWLTLPLSVQGPPDLEDTQVDQWIDVVNGWYAPAHVRFVVDERRALPDDWLLLRNNRDRHRFERRLRGRRIHAFIVREIRDPWPSAATRRASKHVGREPSGLLGGAHIPAPNHRPDSYVIALDRAMPLALAHELGHVLGAPHHPDPTNIMSYGRNRSHFDEAQLEHFRRRARRLQRRRDVRPVRDAQ
ncbi:MAG: hypothetical protein JJ863_25175 [Deltaproteobacteria bacterium]|nr:hypothetical protein [Deltaproteobacteria bacterium]